MGGRQRPVSSTKDANFSLSENERNPDQYSRTHTNHKRPEEQKGKTLIVRKQASVQKGGALNFNYLPVICGENKGLLRNQY